MQLNTCSSRFLSFFCFGPNRRQHNKGHNILSEKVNLHGFKPLSDTWLVTVNDIQHIFTCLSHMIKHLTEKSEWQSY